MPKPDEKLEDFHMWANTDDRRRGMSFPAVLVWAGAAVVCIVIAVNAAGWI